MSDAQEIVKINRRQWSTTKHSDQWYENLAMSLSKQGAFNIHYSNSPFFNEAMEFILVMSAKPGVDRDKEAAFMSSLKMELAAK